MQVLPIVYDPKSQTNLKCSVLEHVFKVPW